jgi:hypothetical protein
MPCRFSQRRCKDSSVFFICKKKNIFFQLFLQNLCYYKRTAPNKN